MATGPLIYDEKTYRPTTHSRAAAMIYLKNNKLQENKKEEASFWEAFSKQWVNDGARTHDPRYHKPML